MMPDPTAEMKRIRHQLGADVDFDLGRIFADLQRQQETSGRQYVRLPHRIPADVVRLREHGESTPLKVETFSSPAER